MQPDSLLGREVLLFELKLRGQVKKSEFLLLLGDYLVEESEVIAEEENAGRIVDLSVFADVALEENRGHRGNVFVAEAEIGTGEAGVAGLDSFTFNPRTCRALLGCTGGDARAHIGIQHVAGEDFFCQRHGPFCRFNRWQENFFLHAGYVEGEQASVFDHLASDLVFTGGEFTEGNFFSGADFINQREVRGSQHAEILAILLVDAFNVFGDDQVDAGTHLGVR